MKSILKSVGRLASYRIRALTLIGRLCMSHSQFKSQFKLNSALRADLPCCLTSNQIKTWLLWAYLPRTPCWSGRRTLAHKTPRSFGIEPKSGWLRKWPQRLAKSGICAAARGPHGGLEGGDGKCSDIMEVCQVWPLLFYNRRCTCAWNTLRHEKRHLTVYLFICIYGSNASQWH